MFQEQLNAYIFLYDKMTGILKNLSINSDVVVFEKKGKSKSLKLHFIENSKKRYKYRCKRFLILIYEKS